MFDLDPQIKRYSYQFKNTMIFQFTNSSSISLYKNSCKLDLYIHLICPISTKKYFMSIILKMQTFKNLWWQHCCRSQYWGPYSGRIDPFAFESGISHFLTFSLSRAGGTVLGLANRTFRSVLEYLLQWVWTHSTGFLISCFSLGDLGAPGFSYLICKMWGLRSFSTLNTCISSR